jgi:Fe-S-cluster containining protein
MPENLQTAVSDTRKRTDDRSSAGPIIGLQPSTSASTTTIKRKSDISIIDFELNILGKQLNFNAGVAKRQARLADIVPLARTVCTKIIDAVAESTFRKGVGISCRKNCSACCSYLTPLSVPEVFSMSEEVFAMPANQSKAILQSCLDAAKKILDNIPESFDVHLTANSPNQVRQLSIWYAGLKLPCPFLSGGLCTIYEQRPITCREHIATGSPSLCEAESNRFAISVRS